MRWVRLLVIGLVVLGVLLGAVVIGGKAYLGSARARTEVASQLQESLGLPVRVDEMNVGLNKTSIRVRLYEPDANAESAEPLATIEDVQADLSLMDLARGQSTPNELTLRDAKVTIRLDKNGKLRTKLPKAKGPAKKVPSMRVEQGRLTVRQEGRPDFVVGGIVGDLQTEGQNFAVDGAVHDATWGDWTLKGNYDRATSSGSANLATPGQHVTQDLLNRLPTVPAGVWEQVQAEGDTPVQFKLWSDASDSRIHYRVNLAPKATRVHVESIHLDATDAQGKVAIADDVVTLEGVQGHTADGVLKTDGTLDFDQTPSVLQFKVGAEGMDIQRLPKSWSLPKEITGRLTGTADIKVVLEKTGPVVSGSGKGVVKEAMLAGLPAEPIELRLDSDGKRFRFSQPTAKRHRQQGGDFALLASALYSTAESLPSPLYPGEKLFHDPEGVTAISRWLSEATPPVDDARIQNDPGGVAESPRFIQMPSATPAGSNRYYGRSSGGIAALNHRLMASTPPGSKPPEKLTYFEAKINLKNIDVKQLVEKLKLALPISVSGTVSVQVMLAIPVNQARDVKEYRFHGTVDAPRVVIEGLELKNVKARLDYRDGLLALQELSGLVPPTETSPSGMTNDGSFEGTAELGISPIKNLTAQLTLKDIPLAQILKPIPDASKRSGGRFSGSMNLQAPVVTLRNPKTWQASGSISSRALRVYDRNVAKAHIDLRLEKGAFSLSKITGEIEGVPLSGDASVSLTDPFRLDGKLNVRRSDLVTLNRLVPEMKPPFPIKASLEGTANVTGTLRPLDVKASGTAKATDLQLAKAKIDALNFGWDYEADRLRIKNMKANLYDGTIKASAVLPLKPAAAGEFKADFEKVDLAGVSKDVPNLPVRVAGQVDGKVDAALPPAKPGKPREVNADLDLRAPKLRIEDIPAERLHGTVRYRNGKLEYSLDGDTLGGQFHIDSTAPPDKDDKKNPGEDRNGHLSLKNLELDRLADAWGRRGQVSPLRGTLNASATFRQDSLDETPIGSGDFVLSGLAWGLVDLSDRITGDLRLASGELQATNLSGTIARGRLGGRMGWNLLQPNRRYLLLSLSQADAGDLLAPFPELADRVQGPMDLRLRTSLGRVWTGSGDVLLPRGKVAGVTVTEGRVPVDWAIAPARGYGILTVRDASAQAAQGRLTGQTKIRWGTGGQVDGQVRFVGIRLRSLLSEAAESSHVGNGLMDGKFTFKGDNVRTLNDVNGTLSAKLTQTQGLQLPVLSQLSSVVGLGPSATTLQNGDLLANLGGGVFRIQRLTLSNQTLQLFAQGTVTLAGRLDLDVLANTGRLGVNPTFLNFIGLRIPAVGPIPVSLLLQAGSFLSNRVINLTVTGTVRNPDVQVKVTPLLTEEAVRFFLNRSLPLP
ncbi:MAG: hypothetical protein ACJ8FY_00425 [Gemmataceae bacterium]